MKNYYQILLRHKLIFINVALFLAGAGIRLYRFSDRVLYGPEQAMSLIVSGNYIREKFSLLGQPYFRQTLSGQTLYSGAWFNYSLIPLQYLFDHKIIPITFYFTLLNLITAIAVYKVASLIFGRKAAVFSFFIFLFDPVMIYHSLFLWNYNYLPLVFVLSLYCIFKAKRTGKTVYALTLGILSGFGLSLQLMYVIPFIIFLILISRYSRSRSVMFFLAGAVLGDLPFLLFDLRHGFFQTRNIIQYLSGVLLKGSGGGLAYYHFLYLWSGFAVYAGYIMNKIFNKSRSAGITIAAIFILFVFSTPLVNFDHSLGAIKGLKAAEIYQAAEIISQDSAMCSSFNVVEMYDFDTRAHILRYPLIFKYNAVPEDFQNYKNSECVYSLSTDEYNYQKADMWEINEIKPFNIIKISQINEEHAVFKLTHD